ncbi:MAG: TlpA family protein disulfide reductase [Archangium sp.]|nr:TlpA family protein disulfide reductase [Archangium sp.]
MAGLASGGAGCVKSNDATLNDFRTFMNDLPKQTAGRIPFEPWKLEGRVVLVTFLATWCFPCLTELVVLKRLESDHGEKGFSNIMVGMDLEGRQVLDPFAEGYKLTSPLVVADDRIRAGNTAFGRIRELPTRILFARSGKPVIGYTGVSKYEDLDRIVAAEVGKN